MAKAGNEGLDFPMAERGFSPEPLAFASATSKLCHLGGGAGFVNEDKPVALAAQPRLPSRQALRLAFISGRSCFDASNVFLYRKPCRISQRDSDERSIFTPSAAISAANSGIVISDRSPSRRSKKGMVWIELGISPAPLQASVRSCRFAHVPIPT